MKVIGEGNIHFYDPVDEAPHQPGEHPLWQESVVLAFWDVEQQIYGLLRVGQEPNNTGISQLWSNLWVAGKCYRKYAFPPLVEDDVTHNSIRGGGTTSYTYNGDHHWMLDDPEYRMKVDVTMKDFHQAFGFYPQNAGAVSSEVSNNHIEASGSVSGTIEFSGKQYTLKNVIAYRDHSWGKRDWSVMRAHRWIPAIFGPDLSAEAISWLSPDGSLIQFGYVIRGDELIVPNKVDILMYGEVDGMTNRGGRVDYCLPKGEVLRVEYGPVAPGGLSTQHGYPCLDTMCITRMGDRQGVGVFENGNNTMYGQEWPKQSALVNGFIDNGIFEYNC